MIVRYNEPFATEEEAVKRVEAIYSSYPAIGYSTNVKVEPTKSGWRVVGDRYNSCD